MKRLLFLLLLISGVSAQTPIERHQKIRTALENRNFTAAFAELQDLRRTDAKVFELNNYDYLLGRIAEKRNDSATATAAYQSLVKRNSVLREYALWHLSQIMRSSGNLMLERNFLEQLFTVAPDSLLIEPARMRFAYSLYDSKDFKAVVSGQWSVVSENPKSKVQSPKSDNSPKWREWQVLLGSAYLRGGDKTKAREIFTFLVKELPNPTTPDDFALAAARALDEMDAAKLEDYGKTAPQLADYEHYRRALIYQFNRAFAEARLHYRAIAERYPSSINTPEAVFQLGRVANTEEKYDEAIRYFQQTQGQFPDKPQARDALNAEAAAYARSGSPDAAVERYKTYIEKYINNQNELPENAERPFLNIIDALRDKGRDADALEWVRITREKFRGKLADTLALFSKVRIHLSEGDWASALRELNELENAPDLGGTRVAGGTNKTEIAFLKAYCLEQLGRNEEAVNAYLAIPDGRGEYYGGRATERLRNLGKADKTRDLITLKLNSFRTTSNQTISAANAETLRQHAQTALRLTGDAKIRDELLGLAKRAYLHLPDYNETPNFQNRLYCMPESMKPLVGAPLGKTVRYGICDPRTKETASTQKNAHHVLADELLFLGLYDEAAPELAFALGAKKSSSVLSKEDAFSLALAFKRGDLAHKAVAFAEPLWREVPADYLVELAPREAIELLYPAPYAEALNEFAPPRLVDARFVLSIMRQESRYRADVKSAAAARGLMQFIPSTAARIAGQLKKINFVPNDLYDPPTAVLFGSQYLQNIFKEFPEQPQAVAAAYNGGEANVTRWLVRARSTDPDRYVAEIQFSQSKDYVYKVLANFRTYQTLYDERLRRK